MKVVGVRIERFSDTSTYFMTLDGSKCSKCEHRHYNKDVCDAFPKGIPPELLGGDVQHDKPFEGDHGIRFKQRKMPK